MCNTFIPMRRSIPALASIQLLCLICQQLSEARLLASVAKLVSTQLPLH
uniref:Uncharacterized protein n=1 Tax=Brassica campestris TaxID=3711 RepID=A0A3P6A324_BRACM|nr:unnamed protein product [Brassica rapa]